jgi:TRAP-type uncharacterized transport system substrate-binding protein
LAGLKRAGSVGIYASLGLCALIPFAFARAASAPPADPIQLSIGGGVPDSAAYRWSAALAETLSRPPGLPPCEAGTACGVPGVVASAQSYDDPQTLLKVVTEGKIATAVLPSLPLLRARCALPKDKTPPVSALKVLYRQPLYIVAGNTPVPIAKPKDWIGKTVAVGLPGSDTDVLASALLEAYGLPPKKVKLQRMAPAAQATALRNGQAAVSIFMGHAFDQSVGDLIGNGFRLMSLPDSPERTRLMQAEPVLEASAVAPGTFPGQPATSILAQPVVWVAGPALDQKLAWKLVAAISEVHNQARLAELVEPLPSIPQAEAFQRLPVPLTSGAADIAQAQIATVSVIPCPSAKR